MKKIISYIIMTLMLTISLVIKNSIISNIFLFGTLFQTISITRVMYKIAQNKYGYEEYVRNKENI